jgi:antitoxin ParD1/3/4
MTIPLSSRWEAFVAEQVQSGHFASEREVLEASLELMERRQAKFEALRATIAASEAQGGSHSHEEVMGALQARRDELRLQGY